MHPHSGVAQSCSVLPKPHTLPSEHRNRRAQTDGTTWHARRGTNSRVAVTFPGKLSYFQTQLLHKHNLAKLPVQVCCSGEAE